MCKTVPQASFVICIIRTQFLPSLLSPSLHFHFPYFLFHSPYFPSHPLPSLWLLILFLPSLSYFVLPLHIKLPLNTFTSNFANTTLRKIPLANRVTTFKNILVECHCISMVNTWRSLNLQRLVKCLVPAYLWRFVFGFSIHWCFIVHVFYACLRITRRHWRKMLGWYTLLTSSGGL